MKVLKVIFLILSSIFISIGCTKPATITPEINGTVENLSGEDFNDVKIKIRWLKLFRTFAGSYYKEINSSLIQVNKNFYVAPYSFQFPYEDFQVEAYLILNGKSFSLGFFSKKKKEGFLPIKDIRNALSSIKIYRTGTVESKIFISVDNSRRIKQFGIEIMLWTEYNPVNNLIWWIDSEKAGNVNFFLESKIFPILPKADGKLICEGYLKVVRERYGEDVMKKNSIFRFEENNLDAINEKLKEKLKLLDLSVES
ncbi:MAG: hypothetical protein AB1410_10415 [Acidobacteriota bacterium]